jgi:hypothetical protein
MFTRPKPDVAEGPSACATGRLFAPLQGTTMAGCFVSLSSALLTVVWSIQYSRPARLDHSHLFYAAASVSPASRGTLHWLTYRLVLNSFDVIPARTLKRGGGSGNSLATSGALSASAFTAFLYSRKAIGESRTQLICVPHCDWKRSWVYTLVFLWLRGGSHATHHFTAFLSSLEATPEDPCTNERMVFHRLSQHFQTRLRPSPSTGPRLPLLQCGRGSAVEEQSRNISQHF